MITTRKYMLRDKNADNQGKYDLSSKASTTALPQPDSTTKAWEKSKPLRVGSAQESSTAIPKKDSTAVAWIDSDSFLPQGKRADHDETMKVLWEPLVNSMDEPE